MLLNDSGFRVWAAVLALCFASFSMVTSEFAPISLLSQISADFSQSPPVIGLTVSMYAWIGAVSGLYSKFIVSKMPKKALLIFLMAFLAIANLLTAKSSGFLNFFAARAFGAIAHGIFWATVAATAASIVPKDKVGLATSIVLGGITFATVMGVPLVNLLGQDYDWNTSFLVLAALCGLSAILLFIVPNSISLEPKKEPGLLATIRRKDLALTYFITALTAAAHFSAYTFIEPFISAIPNIKAYQIPLLLLIFGVSGFLGTILGALFIDRNLRFLIVASLMSMAGALAALGIDRFKSFIVVAGLLIIWGVAISGLFAALQTWVLKLSGKHTMSATAIHTAVLNCAIGVGVIIGGGALHVIGLNGVMLTAALLITPAFIVVWRFKNIKV